MVLAAFHDHTFARFQPIEINSLDLIAVVVHQFLCDLSCIVNSHQQRDVIGTILVPKCH